QRIANVIIQPTPKGVAFVPFIPSCLLNGDHSVFLDGESAKLAPQEEQSQGIPVPPRMGLAPFSGPVAAGPAHQQDLEGSCLGKLSYSPSYGVSPTSTHISNNGVAPVLPPAGAQAIPSGSEDQQPRSHEESSFSPSLPPLGVAPIRLAVAPNATIWFALGAFGTLLNVCFPHVTCRSPLLLVTQTALPLAFWALHWALAHPDWEPSLVLLSHIHDNWWQQEMVSSMLKFMLFNSTEGATVPLSCAHRHV
ncbi:hypothetical protein L0F63_005763, partial [Massospora cicadina]